MEELKKKMVKALIARVTSDGTFQRSKIYAKQFQGDKNVKERAQLRGFLFQELDMMMPMIMANKDSDIHGLYIQQFSDHISNCTFNNYLLDERFRIGTAQKLINLYWKLSWILLPDYPKPLHCPFDSIIIQKLDKSVSHIRWTSMDSLNDYMRLVKAAEKAAGDLDLIAEWEMDMYYNLVLD